MIKIKLTPQQKSYVKSIDSKKKRKKQKEEFLMHNFFDSIFKKSGDPTTTAIVLNFELDQSQPIEKQIVEPSKEERIKEAVLMLKLNELTLEQCKFYKTDMCKVAAYSLAAEFRDKEKEIESKNTELNFKSNPPKLTNEILREVTEPKVKVVKDFDERLEGTGYEDSFFKVHIPIGTPIEDVLKEIDNFHGQNNKTEVEVKTYTHEDMFNCFSESRLTNPIVGFKHDSFAAYLKSLE